jgi:hypothetical protein
MNCFADALICAAAAHMLRHDLIDFNVGRIGAPIKKCGSFHNHSRLAEAALCHIFVNPGGLAGMFAYGGETFNRSETFISCPAHRNLAGANGCAVFMDCAGATYPNAASVLCSTEVQFVTQDPEQRRFGFGYDLSELAIDVERILWHCQKPAVFDALDGTTLASWEFGFSEETGRDGSFME